MDGLRRKVPELHPHCSLHYFYGALPPGFLWPVILIHLVQGPYLVYFRILPCVCMPLLAKMGISEEANG